MEKFHKIALMITSLIGLITITVSLVIPFIIPNDIETAQLVGCIWMLITGFTIFYFSNKLLTNKKY